MKLFVSAVYFRVRHQGYLCVLRALCSDPEKAVYDSFFTPFHQLVNVNTYL